LFFIEKFFDENPAFHALYKECKQNMPCRKNKKGKQIKLLPLIL